MANTPNFNLYKPNRADNTVEVDVSLADNFTKIDTELQNNKGGLDAHINNPNAHTSENVSHADGSVKTTLENHEERLTAEELAKDDLDARLTDIETLGIDKLAPNLDGRISTLESDIEGVLAPATFDAMDQQSYTFDEYRIGYVDSKLAQIATNYDSVATTFENGVLTKVEEKEGDNILKSSILTYNSDGTLNDVTETYNGKTVKTTLIYVNGEFSSVTKAVV